METWLKYNKMWIFKSDLMSLAFVHSREALKRDEQTREAIHPARSWGGRRCVRCLFFISLRKLKDKVTPTQIN